jgi:hypothetical protein
LRKPLRKRRKPAPASTGGGNLLLDVLTMPVLGVPRMIHWVAEKMAEELERQELDEGKLRGQLLDLQMRYELGDVDDEQYTAEEKALLDRLSLIRKAKEPARDAG